MKNRTGTFIVILALCAGAAAAALGFLAFGMAENEERIREQERFSVLAAESANFAKACNSEMEKIRSELIRTASVAAPDYDRLLSVMRKEGLVRDVFLCSADGTLVAPRKDSSSAKRFNELFFSPVQVKNGKGKNGRLATVFQSMTEGRRSGFIPWYSGTDYTPFVWAVGENDGRIRAFEIDMIFVYTRLLALFPDDLPPYFRIELVAPSGNLIHASGGSMKDRQSENAIVIQLAPALFPNCHVRGVMLPDKVPSGTLLKSIWLQILALCLIILCAGLFALHLVRRELVLAGKKTSFVSQVSHELKTPLTSIRMYAELLASRGRCMADDKREHYLSVICDESERLSRMVDNVLDFGRLGSGRRQYHLSDVCVNDFLASLKTQLEMQMSAAGMTLEVLLPDEKINIISDPDALSQVVHNLADNAVKYASSGKRLVLTLARDGISVRDFGSGVPRYASEKIFRSFYRVDNSLSAASSGSGLGLAIARGLMRGTGGDLVYEKASPGACFRIIFKKTGK